MGAYLNPGRGAFEEAVNSEIFIDKTGMIRYTNSVVSTSQKYISVSRPRRFGKTMAARMLCAYYGRGADSRTLFEERKIAKENPADMDGLQMAWDIYLESFDVIRIVMTDIFKKDISVEEALERLQRLIIRDIKKEYPQADYYDETDLIQTMEDVFAYSGCQFVIIIDEWDAVFRERVEDREGQERYLDFLRDWMKDKEYIALAYMTGILPIKKYGKHSALNMFTECSMIAQRQMAPFTGFVETEVRELCEKYEMRYEDISEWYDGYLLSDRIPPKMRESYRRGEYSGHKYEVYSPLSVVESMTTGRIQNYWNKTETYEALAGYIRRDYDGLKNAVALLMDGGRLRIDTSTYQNDMMTFAGRDDILSLLIHLGYLGFDDDTSEVFIPNREILDEFRASTKSLEWAETFKAFEISLELLQATWDCDENKVAQLVEDAHNRAGNKTYNDESALSYGIQLAYYAAQKYYTTVLEFDSGKGYADVLYLPSPKYPDKPVLLIELKYNQDAETALLQIRRQKYPDRLEHYKGHILLVGIDYDKDISNELADFKHHHCKIEKA